MCTGSVRVCGFLQLLGGIYFNLITLLLQQIEHYFVFNRGAGSSRLLNRSVSCWSNNFENKSHTCRSAIFKVNMIKFLHDLRYKLSGRFKFWFSEITGNVQYLKTTKSTKHFFKSKSRICW